VTEKYRREAQIAYHDEELAVGPLDEAVQRAQSELVGKRQRRVVVTPPLANDAYLAVIYCPISKKCSRSGLAFVWQTGEGLLWLSHLHYAHSHSAPPPEWVGMEHPDTGGRALVPPSSFDQVYRAKGWRQIPRTSVPREWEPIYGIRVWDLLDFESEDHPMLWVKCDDHGEVPAHRLPRREQVIAVVRAECATHAQRPMRIPLSAVLSL